MKLSKEQVQHIARLARIQLTEKEVEKYSKELSAVLDYIDQLNTVDTNGVSVTRQATGLTNITRRDEVAASDLRDELLKAAPSSDGETVNVKAIL
ncbi:MAG: Asp-tRNA(Asn)/Glu-tRNA(Gln) amidotransferase subunit GatC [Candidatus Kerfeldbacteria bacterium]|nr:Asp-tRNA(Asn)/Glu-tRNA(Gln) amidotransferase subunit GatC [Candidatus Kerfeldbacteria bacterium]